MKESVNITDEQFVDAMIAGMRSKTLCALKEDGSFRVMRINSLRLEEETGRVATSRDTMKVDTSHHYSGPVITGLNFTASLDSTSRNQDLRDALDQSVEFTKAAIKDMRDEELRREKEAAVAKRQKAMARWLGWLESPGKPKPCGKRQKSPKKKEGAKDYRLPSWLLSANVKTLNWLITNLTEKELMRIKELGEKAGQCIKTGARD
jgi:hypothetical protein